MQTKESLSPDDELLAQADAALSECFIHADRNHPLIKMLFGLSKLHYIENQQLQNGGSSS